MNNSSPPTPDGTPVNLSGFLPTGPDPASFSIDTLLAKHIPLAAKIVRRLLRNEADVLDVVQQTALKATAHFSQFREESGFPTWLVSIALNETRMLFRQQKRQSTSSLHDSLVEPCDRNASPEESLRCTQRQDRVQQAVKRLPTIYRVVLQLCELEECSIQQVAQQLQITPAAVKSRRMRGRLLLKKQMGRQS